MEGLIYEFWLILVVFSVALISKMLGNCIICLLCHILSFNNFSHCIGQNFEIVDRNWIPCCEIYSIYLYKHECDLRFHQFWKKRFVVSTCMTLIGGYWWFKPLNSCIDIRSLFGLFPISKHVWNMLYLISCPHRSHDYFSLLTPPPPPLYCK